MERVTLTAVIPVAQYGNIQPTFEAEGETHAEAMDLALAQMKDAWDRLAAKPLSIAKVVETSAGPAGKPLYCWASKTEVFFEPVDHIYDSGDGKPWLSGSTFASRYSGEFASKIIAGKVAAKYGVDASDVLAMWELNRDTSSTVGSSVHMALQLRGEYADLSRATKDGSLEACISKNPILTPIVESFFETRDHEVAKYECFVADPVRHHCGLIDRLRINDDGSVDVEDFKTNTELDKKVTVKAPFKDLIPATKMGIYWLQLSFYSRILTAHGKVVNKLRIHHWTNGQWVSHEFDPIDLDAAFENEKVSA